MKAIIFDFDGVLADTYNYGREIVKKIGYDVSEEVFKAHHDGNVLEEPKIPFTEESLHEYYIEYFKEVHKSSPFLSLDEIKQLNNCSKLFIISSNDEKAIEKFLIHHELDYFERVLGYNFHKSKVEKFKYLFREFNLNVEECVFITDTLGDILEGNKVGIKTIAVDFGFHERERLEKGNPFKIVSNFDEIIKVVENIN